MILGPPQAQAEQFVLLLHHQFRPTALQGQSPQLVAPFGHGILGGVEYKRTVGRPFEAGDPLGQGSGSLPGSEVFAVEGVLAEARDIGAVQQCGARIADLEATESEERMALSQEVQIEQDLLWGLGIRSPIRRHLATAMNGILTTLFGPRVVVIGPAPKRDGKVGLLDAPQHFLVEQLTKGLGLYGAGFHVSILRFQVANHLRVGFFAEPEPGVIDRFAMPNRSVFFGLSDRRFRMRDVGSISHDNKGCAHPEGSEHEDETDGPGAQRSPTRSRSRSGTAHHELTLGPEPSACKPRGTIPTRQPDPHRRLTKATVRDRCTGLT